MCFQIICYIQGDKEMRGILSAGISLAIYNLFLPQYCHNAPFLSTIMRSLLALISILEGALIEDIVFFYVIS